VSTFAVGAESARRAVDADTADLSAPLRSYSLRPDPPTGIIGRWVERVRGVADEISTAQIDIRQIKFSATTVWGFVVSFGALLTTVLLAWGDVRQVRDTQESQGKLQDERNFYIRESIDGMKRRQELQQYEINGLKELVIKLQAEMTARGAR
jgi:hypothetical protein